MLLVRRSYFLISFTLGFAAIQQPIDSRPQTHENTDPESVVGDQLQSRGSTNLHQDDSSDEVDEKSNKEEKTEQSNHTHSDSLTIKTLLNHIYTTLERERLLIE